MEMVTETFEDLKQNEDVMSALRIFVRRCCEVCWIMILQDPPLELEPMKWRAAKEGVTFNSKDFVKIMGSDRKSESANVLYYVWPNITRKGTVLGDQKWRVLVRDEMYRPEKGVDDIAPDLAGVAE